MPETDQQRQWRQDSMVLGELGAVLASAELPRVEVRLPKSLGERAVAAWERDDGEGPLDPENYEQRVQRHRAATLALIGLSITELGRWEGDEVVVQLSPAFLGVAIDAADDVPAR